MESNVEVNNVVKKKFFTPIKIGIILTLIVVIIGGGIIYSKQKAEVTYKANLNQVVTLVQTQGAKIETDSQAISSVWHDAIFSAPVTVNGQSTSDFNKALEYKNQEFQTNGELEALVQGKTELQTLMGKLVNPSTKNKDAYNLVIKIYDSYTQFEAMVESPTGNLTGYVENFNTLDASLSSQLNEYRTRYPVGK